jgi:hypothetical protein
LETVIIGSWWCLVDDFLLNLDLAPQWPCPLSSIENTHFKEPKYQCPKSLRATLIDEKRWEKELEDGGVTNGVIGGSEGSKPWIAP